MIDPARRPHLTSPNRLVRGRLQGVRPRFLRDAEVAILLLAYSVAIGLFVAILYHFVRTWPSPSLFFGTVAALTCWKTSEGNTLKWPIGLLSAILFAIWWFW